VTTWDILKNPSSDAKKPRKTQVEFNAVTSVLSNRPTCHGKRQDYDFTHVYEVV